MLQTPILQQIVRFFITYTPQICSRASKPNTIYQKFNQSRLEAHYKIEDYTAAGVKPTRYSWFLISFGTPTNMYSPQFYSELLSGSG